MNRYRFEYSQITVNSFLMLSIAFLLVKRIFILFKVKQFYSNPFKEKKSEYQNARCIPNIISSVVALLFIIELPEFM